METLLESLETTDDIEQGMPRETTIGHVHLHVADLDETMRFYRDIIGFDDQGIARDFRMGMVSAGGYHHHIGFNTWRGEGVPPPPDGALGMRHFTVFVPNHEELARILAHARSFGIASEETDDGVLLRDPSQNRMIIAIDPK